MDDLGVHHPAGYALDPPDYASLLTAQAAGEESISEQHVVFCAAVAAACLLVPLLTAQALKLLRLTSINWNAGYLHELSNLSHVHALLRSEAAAVLRCLARACRPMPAAPPPPPLTTLSQDVQHAATPSTQQQPSHHQTQQQQQQQQQGDGGFGSPFTRSVLVYSTKTGASGGATPASPPMHTPASTAIPLLTEINQLPSPAVASTSMWTVSKWDVLLRRGKQQAQQQQHQQRTAQAASTDAGSNAAAAATLSHTGANGRGVFAKAAASSAAGSAGAAVAHAAKAAVSGAQAGAQALLNSGCKAAGLLQPLWQRRQQQQQQAGFGAANGHVYRHQDAGLLPAAAGKWCLTC